MVRSRYFLYSGLAVSMLIAIASYSLVEAPVLIEYAPHAFTLSLAGIALTTGYVLASMTPLRDYFYRENISPSAGSTSYPAGFHRVRSFLNRLLSPMSGGHRLAGSVAMTSV